MAKFREIIRLHELGRNQTEIAHSCGVARSTVQDYTRRADAKGLSYATLEKLSDSEAQAVLGKQTGSVQKRVTLCDEKFSLSRPLTELSGVT